MPDIYCSKCGEPWDIYELHDMPQATVNKRTGAPAIKALSFKQAQSAFAKYGCGAFDTGFGMRQMKTCRNAIVDPGAADRALVNQLLSEHADEWIE